MDDQEKEEIIEECKDWIASRTAWVDQKTKQFDTQYGALNPRVNKARLDDLEAMRFRIDIHRWELEEFINSETEE